MEYKIKVPYVSNKKLSFINNYAKLRSSENVVLQPGERKIIHTGVSCEIPEGFEMQIVGSCDFDVVNEPGTIDSDYRGEIGVIALNNLKKPIEISEGDLIAKGIISKICQVDFVTDNLSKKRDNTVCVSCEQKAKIPTYETMGSAGVDIASVKDCTLYPHSSWVIETGLTLQYPNDLQMSIRSRSGLAAKYGIQVTNPHAKTKKTYGGFKRAEYILVHLHNTSNESFNIEKGMRIAQIVFSPASDYSMNVQFVRVSELSDTDRGVGGFGSTGIKHKK